MCAVLAPLVNSYKRLVPGYEAPVYISWGQINRSALIRVPQVQPDRPESTRLELRCPIRAATPTWPLPSCCAPGSTASRGRWSPRPSPTKTSTTWMTRGVRRAAWTRCPARLGEALDRAAAR